jgi:hypothetical protein
MRKSLVILIATLCAVGACTKVPSDQPVKSVSVSETTDNGIGYPTVQAALTTLKAKPGVRIRNQRGWTMIEDQESKDAYDVWAFAPQGDPAYPAVVKRVIYKQDGQVFIKMAALCESTQTACDALVGKFKAMNDQIKAEIVRRTRMK